MWRHSASTSPGCWTTWREYTGFPSTTAAMVRRLRPACSVDGSGAGWPRWASRCRWNSEPMTRLNMESAASSSIRAATTVQADSVSHGYGVAGYPSRSVSAIKSSPDDRKLPWSRVFIYWSDERRVPLDDPASNYAMARAALLDHVPVPADQVFPLTEENLPALDRVPKDRAGLPRFDIIHLGIGEDGHTASLFPGSEALNELHAIVRAVDDAPKPPPRRLTLTLPVLNAARTVLVMVAGASKREALARVLRRDPALPASHVQPVDGELEFIVDQAAFGR